MVDILHVDDKPDFADLTATLLEREDGQFTVETANSANDGLQRIDDRQPDCIVSDYNMPGMNGLEFLQAVRERYPDLPFILFTGKGSEAIASDAISAGVTDYLQKGTGTERYELLANRIRNAVRARSEAQRVDRQQQLMRLTEFAGDTGGWELDRESGTILLTAGARRIVGRPDQAEISLEEAIALFHPDDRKDIQQTLTRAFETGEELHNTWRLQPGDGDERLIDMTITPVVESGGRVTKLRGSGNDITDRKERQLKLEGAEVRFQHAQDSLFMINVGEEFIVERVNPSWEDGRDMSEAQVRGRTLRDVFGEQTGAAAETKYRECVQRQEPLQYEETGRSGGELTYWLTRIAPVVVDGTVEYIVGSTRDITEQKERIQELEEYKTIVESLTDAVYVLDEEGRFTYVSDEFVELVGYDRETILDSDPSLIKDEDAVELAEHHLGRLLSGDGPEAVTFEVNLQPRDGDSIICEDHMGVLPYEGDKFEGSVGTLRDITPVKERERQLERQNDLFDKAQDIADVGAWSYDVKTDQLFLTDKTYEIHGLSPDDELGPKKGLNFYHPDDRPVIRDAFDRAIETGKSYDLELRLIDAADNLRWVRTRGDPEMEDGSAVSVRGTVQDITELKHQEQELEDRTAELETLTTELEEQYRHLFEEAPVMAVVTRAEEGKPVIEDCNGLFVETVGYERTEIIGADLERFYTAESQRKLLEKGGYERALSGEFIRENRGLMTADGETVETLFRAVPREGAREQSPGTLAFYVDISERKRLERQRDRLAEFTSIVSHDLRNPLAVADGHIELAQHECDSDHLARADDAIDRSQALIDDLLTLAREGIEVTGTETVALEDVAQHSWEAVETQRATLETDATQVLKADKSRLQQLFENLYRNAIEHVGDGVTVQVGDLDDGFYVSDTGSGIPESDREEIFDAGYSTAEHGTGFGLRIVEQIVEAHGWKIRVTDSEAGGARFEVVGVETPT